MKCTADRLGLLVAAILLPFGVYAQAFTRAPEDLMWSFGTALGAFLGLALHVTFSWGEWRKITANKPHLWQYIYEDMPGFLTAVIMALIAYFGLPVLGSIPAVQNFLGFTIGMNFLSATAASYIASSLGYKIRAYFIKKTE